MITYVCIPTSYSYSVNIAKLVFINIFYFI